jgi:hypothetical protein
MLRSSPSSGLERAAAYPSTVQVAEKSPHHRIWLSTAVYTDHACAAKYLGANEAPTLRATSINSCYRAYYWSYDVVSIGVMHKVIMYASTWPSNIIIAEKGEPLTTGHWTVGFWPGSNRTAVPTIWFIHIWLQLSIGVLNVSGHSQYIDCAVLYALSPQVFNCAIRPIFVESLW